MLVITPVKGEFIQIGEARIWISDRGRKVRIDAPAHVRVVRERVAKRATQDPSKEIAKP